MIGGRTRVAGPRFVLSTPGRTFAVLVLLIASGTGGQAQVPGAAAALYTRDDLLFLHHMIVHHEQALALAELVPSRTAREELVRFAGQVDRAQRAEIDQMKELLAVAADRGMKVSDHDLHSDSAMPGILSSARMDALAAARGSTFERLWLEGMIFHHEGALAMGREQQRRQFESRRQPYGIDVLVDEILVVQRAEITTMKGWLAQATASALPSEIPLFPLPETTLFPGASRPLLIFEPRYREMIADALKGDRIIGMVRLRPGFEKDYEGRPPIYAIGCAGAIEEYEQLPDGRYVILLRGLTTFRVLGENQRKPYRLARVEAMPGRLEEQERLPLSSLRTRLERLLVTVLPFGVEPPDRSLDDDVYVNVVAQNLPMSEDDRQQLLERPGILARAQALVELLGK